MPSFAARPRARFFLRLFLTYAAVFGVWLVIAPVYHQWLAEAASRFIPVLGDAQVSRLWLANDERDGGVGAHFEVVMRGRDPEIAERPDQTLVAKTETVVDIRQFGYPMITFVVLALSWMPGRWTRQLLPLSLGLVALFVLYSFWVSFEVFQYLAIQDIAFLQETLVARWVPPPWYQQHRVALVLYMGQLLPVAVFGVVCLPRALGKVSDTTGQSGHHRKKPRPLPESRRSR